VSGRTVCIGVEKGKEDVRRRFHNKKAKYYEKRGE
jgi:hypothetical protein